MFGKQVDAAILEYSKSVLPNEACGYINAKREFVPLKNVASNPKEEFKLSYNPKGALAIVHSHPDGPFYPSELDMRQQIATALPWGIAGIHEKHNEVFWFGDDAPIPPLVGRGFRHGVTDCYSLVRDYYRSIHSILIPEFPRSWEWWTGDAELYVKNFKQAGFAEIDLNDALPGDGFIATIGRSKSANHAGVYLGNGLVLHHVARREGYAPDKLSVIEPAVKWMQYVTKVLRYENGDIDRTFRQDLWQPISIRY